ncbi:MAG: sensor histidine kinase, partial [Bacteroidota bacterium]
DLRHANEILRQRNEELQEFAYVASHDLKEPLRKVRTFSGMLVDEYADRLEGDGRMYVERMQDAVERMMILINDLLALSRVSTRTQPFQQVALQSVLDDVLTDFDIDLERTGGRIEVVTPLPVIEADPSQMRQLFQNLIGNAVKYARAEEPPIIRIGSASTETDEGYPAVQLRVEDNGIGFDPKYADRIFGAFQRLHGRGQYEGSGMGLAICKRIVERHRGRIAVESTPGQGAAFIVTLPTSARSTNESEA